MTWYDYNLDLFARTYLVVNVKGRLASSCYNGYWWIGENCAGKAEEERAQEFEMKELASAHEASEAKAHADSLAALHSSEMARARAREADTAQLTTRRLQSMSENMFGQNSPSLEEGLTKLRTSLTSVEEQLSKRGLQNEELELKLSEAHAEHAKVKANAEKSEEMSKALQEQVQQLMLASSAACELRNAEASLGGKQVELEALHSQLEAARVTCYQISEEREEQFKEAKTESLAVEELQCKSRQIELKVQRAEAKLHTQDRRYKQEREEWQHKLRQLQLSEIHSQNRTAVEESLTDSSELRAQSEKNEALVKRKALLQKEAQQLESELESAKRRNSLHRKEAEARHQADEIRRNALIQEINAAKGHVAALAQETDRLRQATLARPESKANDEPKTLDSVKVSQGEQGSHADSAKRRHLERLLAQQEKQELHLNEQIDASKRADPSFQISNAFGTVLLRSDAQWA